ncbi:Hypothetical predicted protein [Paramuricea clavata]|uniref:Uncharacterized protein n=1 Tax=Paramuricea clavata TaxID=317549 RepID=A0A6S7LGT7_PARCT|nr:Hypothetical predicted protein [Paramuricea clavata]
MSYNSQVKLVFIALLFVYTAEAKSCNGSAKYTLTFRGEWTDARHANFPSNPHFSPGVGCSHNASYVMWKSGILATTGVKNVAEFGSTVAINTEMDSQIASKNAYKRYSGRLIFGGTASDSISNIEINSQYPLVSFITMIAPSPDWFLGVHDLNLCNTVTGEWQDREVKDLFPYDAGTDSGPNFESGNVATNPPVNIHLITNDTEGSLKGDKPVKSFGTFTFVNEGTPAPPTGTTSRPTTPTGTATPPTGTATLPATGAAPPATPPTGKTNPGTNFNITLILILCILNIIGYLL